jgi:cell division inhibitor SulA
MPRYVIERDIPGIGLADREALREAAEKSNGGIYIADNESLLQEHSQRSGFPITKIIEVLRIIDPVTAES